VLIVTLIAMTLLVGLVFYVYNVGDQVNERLQMQCAADSVAVTGAGWMARNMNVVAMNNVGQAKMLSLVPVLDTQPLATEMAFTEVSSWTEALAGVLSQGRIDPQVRSETEAYLRGGIQSLHDRMAVQRDILAPYNHALNQSGFTMEQTTHWAVQGTPGSPPHGALWRAAVTLDEFSRGAVESCGVLAQSRASRFGRRNGADAAFLVPVLPKMPARLGEYMDFQPTIRGRLKVTSDFAEYRPTGGRGGAIPDVAYPHRLGPWARLHRWRDYIRRFVRTGRQWAAGREGVGRTRGSQGNVNVGGRRVGRSARSPSGGGHPGHWQATGYSELMGYYTYGPYEWAKRHIHWWARGHGNENPGKLRDTYYYEYLSRIAQIKLDYMFPPSGLGSSVETKLIHYPQWIVNYPECKALGEDENVRVTSTMLYLIEIASKYPEESPSFMTPGTFRTNGEYPIAMWTNGWSDPNKWNIPQVANYVWKDAYQYETTQDRQLGIQRETIPPGDPNGQVVWHPVYMYAWYIFGGIDVGGEVEVVNPCNWDEFDLLPRPMLLDTSEGDYGGDDPDVGFRRDRFTYLGVVRRHSEAPVWQQRFTNANPFGSMVCVAQAKVFNNKSFGLWTQDWRVGLAPVSQWNDWMERLELGIYDAGALESVDPSEIEGIYQYLSAIDADVAELYLHH
jgi:hypothetical protein